MLLDDLTDSLFALESDILEAEKQHRAENVDPWASHPSNTKEPRYLIEIRHQRENLLEEIDRLTEGV